MNRHQRRSSPKDVGLKTNEVFRIIENEVAGYKGRCLFVTDDTGRYCNEPVNNSCHIVSESAVLHGLKDGKTPKLLELQWGISQWRRLAFNDDVDSTTFHPPEKTTGKACVGRFACKLYDHDGEFFPIDVAEPDFCDPEVRLLSGYRLALFMADHCRQPLEVLRRWNRAARNAEQGTRVSWLRETNRLMDRLRKAESNVKLLGKNWHARKTGGTFDPDVVSAKVFTFRSKLRLAGGLSYGKATAVTVFPTQGDTHKMGVLYLTSQSDLVGEDIERLAGVARASEESENYGVTVTDDLLRNGWGVIAASPGSYEALDERDRRTIQSLVEKLSRTPDL